MNKILLVISLLLTGCATKPIPDAILPPPAQIVNLDPSALELCLPLIGVPSNATFDDILKVSLDNMEIYANCAAKQKNSVKLLKKFSNIKE